MQLESQLLVWLGQHILCRLGQVVQTHSQWGGLGGQSSSLLPVSWVLCQVYRKFASYLGKVPSWEAQLWCKQLLWSMVMPLLPSKEQGFHDWGHPCINTLGFSVCSLGPVSLDVVNGLIRGQHASSIRQYQSCWKVFQGFLLRCPFMAISHFAVPADSCQAKSDWDGVRWDFCLHTLNPISRHTEKMASQSQRLWASNGNRPVIQVHKHLGVASCDAHRDPLHQLDEYPWCSVEPEWHYLELEGVLVYQNWQELLEPVVDGGHVSSVCIFLVHHHQLSWWFFVRTVGSRRWIWKMHTDMSPSTPGSRFSCQFR